MLRPGICSWQSLFQLAGGPGVRAATGAMRSDEASTESFAPVGLLS